MLPSAEKKHGYYSLLGVGQPERDVGSTSSFLPQASAVYLLDSKTMFSDTYHSAFSTAVKRRRPVVI